MPALLRAPTRVVRSPVADSRRWEAFEPRDDDIIIATYRKCGTTWTQRIVDLLVFQSPDIRPFGDVSPWLDATIFRPLEEDIATLEAQAHRRFVKSHLPFDALPLWDHVKYIHVGRDGRDACLSWQNHILGTTDAFRQRVMEEAKQLAGTGAAGLAASQRLAPAEDPHDFFVQWLDELERAPTAEGELNLFEFEATYWRERKRPNLLFVHYNDLRENLAGEMRRISDFLGIATPASLLPALAEAARFAFMKQHGDALFPRLRTVFDRGADRFINQGRSGRWRELARPEDIARYQAISRRAASPSMADWLERGRLGAGDPRIAAD